MCYAIFKHFEWSKILSIQSDWFKNKHSVKFYAKGLGLGFLFIQFKFVKDIDSTDLLLASAGVVVEKFDVWMLAGMELEAVVNLDVVLGTDHSKTRADFILKSNLKNKSILKKC